MVTSQCCLSEEVIAALLEQVDEISLVNSNLLLSASWVQMLASWQKATAFSSKINYAPNLIFFSSVRKYSKRNVHNPAINQVKQIFTCTELLSEHCKFIPALACCDRTEKTSHAIPICRIVFLVLCFVLFFVYFFF